MPNNVFEGLDEILARQKQAEERSRQEHEEILEAINRANAKTAQADQVQRTVNQRNQSWSLKNFINRSVHEYMWLGTKEDFDKDKKLALILILSSIVSMIICTIVASISFGIYSTFTLFENIWLLMSLFILKYVIKAKKIYLSHVYAFNSIENFDVDADGVFRSKGNKKRYKVFLVLACIAFCSNTICAWSYSTAVAVWLSILELGCMVLSIVSFHLVDNLFLGYGPIKFTGPNESGTYDVVLIFDTLMNKLYTEEEYLKKYSFMK